MSMGISPEIRAFCKGFREAMESVTPVEIYTRGGTVVISLCDRVILLVQEGSSTPSWLPAVLPVRQEGIPAKYDRPEVFESEGYTRLGE